MTFYVSFAHRAPRGCFGSCPRVDALHFHEMSYGPLLRLLSLGAIFGYAVYHRGGVDAPEWNRSQLALGILALFCCWPLKRRTTPPLERWFSRALVLLLLYVAFQL